MARGQKRKTLTSRAPSSTGHRKGRKSVASDENINPAGIASPSIARPKPRPKPRPTASKPANPGEENGEGEAEAAHALVSLQNHTNYTIPSSPTAHHDFGDTQGPANDVHLAFSDEDDFYASEEEHEDQDQFVGDSEDEVDELENDSGSDNDSSLLLPTGTPTRRRLPEFRIPFVVPYRNASRDVDGITSKTSFTQVLRLIADRMDVPLTLLAGIGYIPSYKPKSSKPIPKLLEDDASWYKLLEDVHAFILACKGKSGKGAIKPFHINIIDTTAPNDSDSKKKKKIVATEPPAPALTSKESAQLSALKKLENRHMCQQHKKPCIIQPDGEHYHLTMNDITKWAHLMAENKALLDTPPSELNLTDVMPRQHSAKKAMAKSQTESAALPEWMEKLVGMMFVGNMATNNRVMSLSMNPPMTPAPSTHIPQTPSIPPIHSSALKRPGSPLDYPSLDIWLSSLEHHPIRGKKAQRFTCYAESLSANGIDDLQDLLRLTSAELISIVPDINIGIAKRMLAFAEEDVSSLQESKRVHLG
ncbi:hypothetical protein BJ912DRAFT_1097533 [Pholiota molesta]|nr:hypothetical protein BJ912DRAFT_1097533 [Pholiota molesta]